MSAIPDPQPDMLAAALQYAEEGVAVFPLHEPVGTDGGCTCNGGRACKANPPSPGKHPRVRNGVHAATTDAEQIRRWWEKWPTANIGGAMGEPSGVWVVDVDGPDGEASLAERDLPTTLVVRTGRADGGRHLFFRMPATGEAIGNRSKFLPGLDVRGTGGYVVLAPSRHPSGSRYAIDDDASPAVPPEWLVSLVAKRSPSKPATPATAEPALPLGAVAAVPSDDIVGQVYGSGQATSGGGTAQQRVLGMIRAACDRIRSAPEGSRNDTVNRECFGVGGFLDAAGLSVDDAAPELEAAAQDAEQDPRQVRRALEDGRTHPRQLPPDAPNRERTWHGEGGAPPPHGGDAPATATAVQRPVIVLGPDLAGIVDEAVAAVVRRPDVFVRNGQLVRVAGGKIHVLSAAALRTELARAAEFVAALTDKQKPRRGDYQIDGRWYRAKHPPEGLAPAVRDAGHWPGAQPLRGVSCLPPLRPDASAATTPGYDADTELWYAPSGDVPMLASLPSLDDACSALVALRTTVQHFPFDSEADFIAWVAGVATPIAWPMYRAATPAVVVDAPGRDVGKSRLCSLGVMVATGAPARRKRWAAEPEEQSKILVTVAAEGVDAVMFDNVSTTIGGSALDAYATAGGTEGVYSDRLLGGNTMVETDRPPMLWFSANNASFSADTARRVLSVRLIWRGEGAASERTLPRLPTSIDAPRLWAWVVTILRAWVVAGRPIPTGQRHLSSFEPWSGVVAAAVRWVSGIDPLASRSRLAMVDETERRRDELFAALARWSGTSRFTSAEAVRAAGNDVLLADALHEAGCASRRTGNLDPGALGYKLRAYRDQVDSDGNRLVSVGHPNRSMVWQFQRGAA